MSEWRKVKIGDFLKRKRIPIQLESDKEYKLITIKLYHKGVYLRGNKKGSEIHSNMYKVSKGDFILSGIDARNGAFGIVPDSLDGAIVTNDFWYFDIDESMIKKEFFLWLTSTPVFLDACQKASMGETQRIRLQKDAFFNYQIKCPSIEYQDEFLARINPIIEKIKIIQSETEKQTEYAKLLRQNILQQAIEGKLTADWRNQNPVQKGNPNYDAEALFEQIQKDRINYWKQNTSKETKNKDLLPIDEFNSSFPETWKRTCLIELFDFVDYRGITPKKLESGIPLITAANIKEGFLSFESKDFISDSEYELRNSRGITTKYDLLFTTEAPMGHCAINTLEKTSCGQRVITLKKYSNINKRQFNTFYCYYIISSIFQDLLLQKATGITAKGIKASILKVIPVYLPPLKEQEEIVNKVETLLAKVTTLENQIQDRKSLSDKLIFGIIKENLEG